MHRNSDPQVILDRLQLVDLAARQPERRTEHTRNHRPGWDRQLRGKPVDLRALKRQHRSAEPEREYAHASFLRQSFTRSARHRCFTPRPWAPPMGSFIGAQLITGYNGKP